MKSFLALLLLLFLTAASALAQSAPAAAEEKFDLSAPAPSGPSGPLSPDAVTLDPDPVPTPSDPSPAKDPTPPLATGAHAEAINAINALSQEQRTKYGTLLAKASRQIQKNNSEEALQRILEAESIYADFAPLQNLKGAAFTKMRAFEKAAAAFQRCLDLNPDSLEAKFNLAEMDFVTNDYGKAQENFAKLLDENPKLAAETRQLLRYKIYLSLLLLERDEEADALLQSFKFDSDTPEYYYANAAKSFHADDKEKASSWLQSARRIYQEPVQGIFIDSLIEIGWIESP